MSRDDLLQKLLESPDIWRPGHACLSGRQTCTTGFSVLDQWLGGGWPLGVLTEVLLDDPGVGELGLMMPALVKLCTGRIGQMRNHANKNLLQTEAKQSSWSVFIAPPHIPYAPALADYHIDVSRLLVITPDTSADALWAMEQVLRSGIFAAVFGWFAMVDMHALRRLQLAAEAGMSLACIFRHTRFASSASPAAVRIRLEPDSGETRLHILRNRYGLVGSVSVKC